VQVYGVVENLKSNEAGIKFIKVVGIDNDEGKSLIVKSDTNDKLFKGLEINLGDRVTVRGEKGGAVEYIRVYKPKSKSSNKSGTNVGILVGHGIKFAANIRGKGVCKTVSYEALGALGHDLTREVQEHLMKDDTSLTANIAGLTAGNLVLCACELVGEDIQASDNLNILKKTMCSYIIDCLYPSLEGIKSHIEAQ